MRLPDQKPKSTTDGIIILLFTVASAGWVYILLKLLTDLF